MTARGLCSVDLHTKCFMLKINVRKLQTLSGKFYQRNFTNLSIVKTVIKNHSANILDGI